MKNFLLFGALFLLLGCSGHDKDGGKEIVFSEYDGEVVFQKTYKILDVPDSLVLGTVIQVEFVDSLIFVLTSQSGSGELHTFDIDGKYVGKIGDKGRGKGEYLMPFSFCINNDKVYLIDGAKRAVLTYDMKTRGFIEECKLPLHITSMAFLNKDLIVSYGQMDKDYFNYLNSGYEIEKSFVENFRGVENSGYSTGSFNPICRVGGKLMLYTPFYTTIYEADVSGIMPKYRLKLADYKMPDKEFILQIANSSTFFSDLQNSGYIFYRDYFETTQAMLVNFFVKDSKYIGYYKKGDAEGKVVKTDKHFDGGYVIGVYEDSFVAVVVEGQEDVPANDIVLLLVK